MMKIRKSKKIILLTLLVSTIFITSGCTINFSTTKNVKNVQHGDINGDGEVNGKDVTRLQKYLADKENNKLDDQELANADVNEDGIVDDKDVDALMKYIAGWDITLPYKEETKNIMYGDVNEDGVVNGKDATRLQKYLADKENNKLSESGLSNADMNSDGVVDEKDVEVLMKYLAGWDIEIPYTEQENQNNNDSASTTESTDDTTPAYSINYGDVNEDGVINGKDVTRLQRYLLDKDANLITSNGLANADVNADGVIDQKDVDILMQYLAGWDITLPYSGGQTEAHVTLYGDVNVDGIVNGKDCTNLEKYLEDVNSNVLTQVGMLNADVNDDNNIDKDDSYILQRYLAGWFDNLPYTGEVSKVKVTLYGDVNEDGKINGKDVTKLMNYLKDKNANPLTAVGAANADVNDDWSIDDKDTEILMKYLADYGFTLPYTE